MTVQCFNMADSPESPTQILPRGGGGILYAGAIGARRGESRVTSTGIGGVEAWYARRCVGAGDVTLDSPRLAPMAPA